MLTKNQFDILSGLAEDRPDAAVQGGADSAFLTESGYITGGKITDAGLAALEPYRVKRAIFIAAGFGSRLVPITLNTPKPLVRVHNVRIIDSLLDAVAAAGIEEVWLVRGYLGDESKVCANVDGDVLRVEVVPGFVYGRVNKPDIIQRFSDAARSISGREMRVLLTELKPKPRQQRSLEELKQFKEVKFI